MQALDNQFHLREYNLKAITGGTDALADVSITIAARDGNLYGGEALHEDIAMASAHALIKCINKSMEETFRVRRGAL